MQPIDSQKTPDAPADDAITTGSTQVAELALLIDAIPPEYREDVLSAVMWIGGNETFQQSYMVNSIRNQLSECLMEKTGTLHDFRMLQHQNRSVLIHPLASFAAAEGMEQIIAAIGDLLGHLSRLL